MKIIFHVFLFLQFSFAFSQNSNQNKLNGVPEYQSRELIVDNTFKRRFYNHALGDTLFTSTIGCTNTSSPTVWKVAEWSSRSSFLNMTPVQTNTGMCKFANNYKDFRFGGPAGAEPYDIYFAVNSQAEYNNMYRQATDPWPHLLVEQRLSPPYFYNEQGPGCPWLSMLRSLIFKVDAKLYYNQTIQNSGYNPNLHAGQFLIYFTVQNMKNSPSHDYMWVGIPLYDDRKAFVDSSLFLDGQTQKLIYSIAFHDLSEVSLHSGSWVSLNVDILPYVKRALQKAWMQNKLLESVDFADYKIGTINMGWELPGMNISTIAVKNLSLIANTNQLFWVANRTLNNANENTSISIFPNPAATSSITVSGKQMLTISIVNNLGQEVIHAENLNIQNEELNIDISNLPSGVYFSLIKTQTGIERIKFLKLEVND